MHVSLPGAMGIKRRASQLPVPRSDSEEAAAVETCQDAAATSAAMVADQQLVAVDTSTNAATLSVNSPGEQKSALEEIDPCTDLQIVPSAPAAPAPWEPGKRMRKKGSFMPRLSSEALDKSPALNDASNLQLVALDIQQSPEPDAGQGVGSPAPISFGSRRRSVASPLRRSIAPASAGRMRATAAKGKSQSSLVENGRNLQSSSSSSSSSSSESTSSSGQPDEQKRVCLFKEGQKFPTPAVSDTARDFFMTLYEENPHSYIATAWLVEHGVFSGHKHDKLVVAYKIQKAMRQKVREETLAASASSNATKKTVLLKKGSSSKVVKLHKRPDRMRESLKKH